jgi:Mor family transcriptional regulator
MLEKSKIDIHNDFTEEEVAAIKPKEVSAEQQLIQMYKAGVTLKQISRKFNVSMGKIYEILNRNRVEARQGRKAGSKSAKRLMTMTAMQKQNLINDYRDGMTLQLIYDKYKINKHGVYTILDENNVPRRDTTEKHHTHNNSRKKEEAVEVKTPSEILTAMDQRVAVHTEPIEIHRDGDKLYVTVTKKVINPINHVIVNYKLEA